ncbi:MAG: hypothetical protein ACJAZN_003079 [Planctomycetota bacterium]|jgi:hypothetical protein
MKYPRRQAPVRSSDGRRHDSTCPFAARLPLAAGVTPAGPQGTARRGSSLVTVLILLAVLTTLMAAFLNTAADGSRAASTRSGRFEIKRSANSINRLTAQSIWVSYAQIMGGADTTLLTLRNHLDGLGLLNQAGQVPAPVDYTNLIGLSRNGAGELILGDTTIGSVSVHREDEGRVISLFVTSLTTTTEGQRALTHTVTDVFSIEAPSWQGLDFALLANNINCIMCHTNVDDVERVYSMGGAAGPAGPGRARVGSIESFQFRDDPDSTIAGTLYLGGSGIDEHGDPITDWGSLNLKAAELNGEGRVLADSFGGLSMENLSPADPSAPAPYENLYLNYLNAPDQVDGEMPGSFPLPFRDDGGVDLATGDLTTDGANNRVVDDNEFNATTAVFAGSINGGRIGLSATGTQISTAAAASALLAGTETSLPSGTVGNVVLTGTELDPIRLDGRVAIDGDLIISGPIEGAGSLWVRGNIYVLGDLEYNDATDGYDRQFGISSSGQTNALGLTAGGNVVIGDIYRPQWGGSGVVDGGNSNEWNFTLEQAAAFNGREWVKTQPTLPGEPTQVEQVTQKSQEQFIASTETIQKPVYKWVPNGTFRDKPVYENVQVGETEVPVYEWVHHANTLDAPYDNSWSEKVQTGTEMKPVYERQQTGTVSVENKDKVLNYYRDVSTTTYTSYDPPQFVDVDVTKMVWETPSYTNPGFMGTDYTARYYQFGEGDPVPIQNKDGYFDNSKGLWVMDEGVPGWDLSKLTLADPTDPNDPILYPATGNDAAITTLEPTDSWMDQDILRGMIQDSLRARNADEALKIDATIYSANSIFGVVPSSISEGTNGEMRVQGAILAADVGLLAPKGLELYYDERGKDVLDIRDETSLGLQFLGTLPAPLPIP